MAANGGTKAQMMSHAPLAPTVSSKVPKAPVATAANSEIAADLGLGGTGLGSLGDVSAWTGDWLWGEGGSSSDACRPQGLPSSPIASGSSSDPICGESDTSASPSASGSSESGSTAPEAQDGLLDAAADWVFGENGGEAWGDILDCVTGEEEWASGPTGGFMPQSLADEMDAVRQIVPEDAADNGMHAWHAGTNAMLADKLGIVGAPLILAGGLFHETPMDWNSWQAEEEFQGPVNHAIDSAMDIVSNVVGMGYGYLDPSDEAVQHAVDAGNEVPGPGDPDPAFGGDGAYQRRPASEE